MRLPKEIADKICRCLRCGHGWMKRTDGPPKACPECNSPYWNVKRGKLKMGRPPAAKRR